jgi:hypothetical protein
MTDGGMSVQEIQAMVDRETRAWDRQDAEALVSLFHPDMVWPWPPDAKSHDPASWVLPQGRYDRERWKAGWQELFRTHELVHNVRKREASRSPLAAEILEVEEIAFWWDKEVEACFVLLAVTWAEVARLQRLTRGIRTVEEAIERFGKPKHDYPEGMTIQTPASDTEPPKATSYRVVRFDGLSETLTST